ncbi:MAG: four helix bundle suffix domain-containing protein [Lentisphaeria bacterium]|nr:four helix bundle suffix domain-containing protein [Lentisphaeria bacterium]
MAGISVYFRTCPSQSVIVANAVLLLLNVACHLLERQLVRLAADFENEGGFSERMYKRRLKKREDI